MPKRLGFFTRLLDQGSAQTRYRLAAEQIRHAERVGFDSAWIAQHHFHEQEGGLPSPLVFLAHVAAQTDRIRLGTAIITLPMENPLRVAEDAAVLDLLTDGRLEVGFGSGGTPTSFLPFGLTSEQRGAVFAATDTAWAPWFVARSEDKKRVRLNIITHLLSQIPYEALPVEHVTLPKRKMGKMKQTNFPFRFIPEKF
ncbi:LLM class flavin-dependent oxidoreductase [Klebsiella quasipneumoniae]|uniref:LLM class flavin-dependent oxidoreductase n=1 Tax=Klebsiella quasipneumoniae TaxID=1463165 RepID=UPI0021582EA4|nr:LLM class flavin-dependent oxidoreductase [Klebsiella quasipneumoniae]